jgi:FtsH-binding integral membrane protein
MIAAIVQLLVGFVTLLYGRRLFWLFIALAGFTIGLLLGENLFRDLPGIAEFFLALVVGGGMAILALFIQRPIAAVGGFLALGAFGLILARLLGASGNLLWIIFLISGIIGAILVFQFFDWALIINSAFSGASAVIAGLSALLPAVGGGIATLLLLVLAAGGIYFQSRELDKEQIGSAYNP